MRQIKFKAKQPRKGWVFGNSLEQDPKNNTYKLAQKEAGFYPLQWCEVDSSTICEFTGLQDMDGKDLYEGDIILVESSYGKRYRTIRFWDGAFYAADEDNDPIEILKATVVQYNVTLVGNKFDNPDIFNQQDYGEGY